VLAGYSFGADVLPFLATRLPRDLRERIALIVLIGPSQTAPFEIHVADWIESGARPQELPVGPELEKLHGEHILCTYGSEETESLCPRLPRGLAELDARPGSHHYDGDFDGIAADILARAANHTVSR
jgi:type IV secretory pathway VirJ component